jgi:hypothetical protein
VARSTISLRRSAITNAEFSALAASWHDFYLTAGAASATLIGLLFVGVSINLDEFTADEGTSLRLLAEQAFSNFVFVLLISLFVLVPNQDPQSLLVQLAIVGGLGLVRIVRRAATFRRGRADPFGGWRYVLRRLGLSAVACLVLIVVAWNVVPNPIGSFFWLFGVVLVYLISAADSAWDLLVEVGRERRRAGRAGP